MEELGNLKYKKIVQVGVNTIVDDEPQSVIVNKVLCNRELLIDINRCFHCKHNQGLMNQFIMNCNRENDEKLPESLNRDPDYKDEDKENE